MVSYGDPHVDPDQLALVALGERAMTADVNAHLASCDSCRAYVDELRLPVDAARDAGPMPLEQPPAHVWTAIAGELSLDQDQTVTPIMHARRARRWWTSLAAAAAVGIVGGVGATLAVQQFGDESGDEVVARAELEPLPTWDATGDAEVIVQPDGSRQLRVDMELASDQPDGFREVWLLTPDVSRMVSLGELDGDTGTVPIPSWVDLDDYAVVDISLEPFDGQPAHSGDSIVRGPLEA